MPRGDNVPPSYAAGRVEGDPVAKHTAGTTGTADVLCRVPHGSARRELRGAGRYVRHLANNLEGDCDNDAARHGIAADEAQWTSPGR
jgi:hypothetical protein